MEKTFENMDKLKSELFEAIDKICKDYETRQEPEFKAGQWYISKSEGRKDKIYRICRINGRYIYYDCSNIEGKSNWIAKDSVMYKSSKPATKEQIESHLKEICDEKYIGKKVKCLFDGEYIVSSFWIYDVKGDKLWYNIRGANTCILLYEEGKFAEIIPDKKKKPETREEFEEFMDDWLSDENEKRNEFLDQYDI